MEKEEGLGKERMREIKKRGEMKRKKLQHQVFPGGHPSKYSPSVDRLTSEV